MARYIDADKMVSKDNAYTTFPHDLAGCDDNDLVRWINEQPTADVAPKSEVEELIKSIDDMLDLVCAMTGLELTYYGKYAEIKKYAELRKKYTEGERD